MLGTVDPAALAADTKMDNAVTVHEQTLARSLRAYGQVEPIAIVQVRIVESGTLKGLQVLPGSVVTAGEVLARINGPRMQSLLTAREQTLRRAQARAQAAGHAVKIIQRLFADHLATRQAVDAAQSDLVAAHAAMQTAAAHLRAIRELQTIRAPVAGTVIAMQAADGEQTSTGANLLTLQPAGKLWIHATYYGTDATLLRVGMTGRFQPSDGDAVIPVKIATLSSGLAVDAGRSANLVATSPVSPTWWVSGQWGTVTLAGPPDHMIPVPTTALILDRGRWWVLVRTPHGDQPRRVVPGPSQGWQTWIASGLHTGEQVVVQDAFLDYHRDIARSYQPPD